jgi:hypothetical protein
MPRRPPLYSDGSACHIFYGIKFDRTFQFVSDPLCVIGSGPQAYKKITSLQQRDLKLETISKVGFWLKIAAGARFKPEAYLSMLRI